MIHVVQWFDDELLEQVANEIRAADGDKRWRRFDNQHEQKFEGSNPNLWGDATREYYLELFDRVGDIEELLELEDLEMEMVGGGWHAIPPGGHLDMHTDFNQLADGRHRRANVLTYLNRGWEDEGGRLIYRRGDDELAVVPELGTTVLFRTDAKSVHGHPYPAQRWRYSIAAYFYDWTDPGEPRSTVWR